MCAWKYKRLMPKITVAKLQLMKQKNITDLVGMNLDYIYSMLEKTPYKPEISEINSKELSSNSLEGALLKNFVKTYDEFMLLAPKSIRLLLSWFSGKFEVNCIKAILRAKEAELSVDDAMNYVTPVGNLDEAKCKKILEQAKNVIDVAKSLSDTKYGLVLEKAFALYEKEKTFYLLEVALDKYVYSMIWKVIGKLGGSDKKIARTIIGIEIDSANVKTILRCKAMGIREDQIKRYLIPISDVFDEKDFEALTREPDIQSFINSLVRIATGTMARDHLYIFSGMQQQNVTSLASIETILDRGLIETNLRMLKRHTSFFNIGLLLAYLNLKWFEVRNLRTIIRGSEGGISLDIVKKMLVLSR
ncbi:V-type ATPase subunit [Thermoproteota archaeon]